MHRLLSPPSQDSKTRNSGKRRALDWRPRTPEEIVLRRNRKVINQHLKRIGKSAGRELTLDHNGVCCFSFKKFVLCIEVPEDSNSICLFHSMVLHLDPSDNHQEVEKAVDLFNRRQSTLSAQELQDVSTASESTCPGMEPHGHDTRLGMKEGEEVNLCFAFPIQGLHYDDTADKLEYFIKTAVAVNRKLEMAKLVPLPEPEALPEEAPDSPSTCIGRRLRMWSVDSGNSTSNMSQRSLFSLFASQCSLPYQE